MITNLDRLEELLSKATPGPWGMITHMGIPGEGTVYGIRFDVGYSTEGLGQHESKLIVEAMNALPGLLREIREQAATIESLQADIDRLKAALKFEKAMDLLLYQRAAEGEMRSWEELPDDEKAARIEYASQFLSYSMPDLFKEAE